VLLVAGTTAAARGLTRAAAARPTGTFTNLTFDEEAGDLLGLEIKIVPSSSGFQAAVLVSEGAPSRMVIVDVTVSGRSVSFKVPAQSTAGGTDWRFDGSIDEETLKGKITHATGAKEDVILARRCGYWESVR
jgi:hypothetical protein